MTENGDCASPSPGTSTEQTAPTEEIDQTSEDDSSERVGILKRAESTDCSTPIRRSAMRSSDSLDSSRPNGILKRKRSCLAKTVSFSAIVSELILPARPLPADMGEYIETDFNLPDTQRPEPSSNRQQEAPPSLAEEAALLQKRRQQELIRERRMRNVDPSREPIAMIRNEPSTSQLRVEDLPQDEDPDEFRVANVDKCGNCTVVFSGKSKKMRFLSLTERCLEFHSNEKSFRAGKTPKYIVDLAMAFNVHDGHFDAKIKYCLCLMTPDETICMRPEGGFATIEGWKRALRKAIHESRRKKMDRVPRPEDFFDASWDIEVCCSNSKGKEHTVEGMTNICKVHENMKGKKRLCIYPHNLAIVDLCIEPTSFGLPAAGFPPFRESNMFNVQRSFITWYFHDGGFFWIGIGQGSYKGYEILFQVENDTVAKEIYVRIEALTQRDIEKKKKDSERQRIPTAVNNLRAREDPERKVSTQSERGELLPRDHERKSSDSRALSIGKSNVSPPQPIYAKNQPGPSSAQPSQEEMMELRRLEERREAARNWVRDFERTEREREEQERCGTHVYNTSSNGPTPPNNNYNARTSGNLRLLEEGDNASDSGDSSYSSRRGTESQRSRPLQPHLACQMPNRAQSFGAKQLKFPNRLPPTVNLPDSERKISAAVHGSSSNQLDLPQDDPRKRAFSLGSRNFFNMIGLNDFRRLVGKRHRTTSPNQTSTSGISLNSSNASPTASSNFLASSEYLEHTRTESFGSSRSSPSKGNSSQRTNSPKESDLMAIDFSQLGKKKNSITDTRRFPFGGSGPGGSMDYNRERQEKEEAERREREQLAVDLKKRELQEAQEIAAKKREAERKVEEKKQRKLEKELEKERERGLKREKKEEKDRDHEQDKDFRPKADSGIADCTPSSSFSGKTDGKTHDGRGSSYVDAEGLKFLADIKLKKKKKEQEASATSSSSSLNTITSNEDNKSRKATIDISKAIGAVNINRRSSACAELNRKPSICTAILEENEGVTSETDSRGEPSDQKASVATGAPAPVTRKTASTGSSLSPFRRLKFLNFRWNS